MSKDNTGGGAFPRNVEGHYFMGMTLRDYFAAKVMQGLVTVPNLDAGPLVVSRLAYKVADAMLKAREE